MKKKIAYGIICAAIMVAAFFTGKATTESAVQAHDPNNWWEDYCNADLHIVDWNTNGSELAFTLDDGTELYAYKEESEYNYSPKRKQYVSFDEIDDMTRLLDGTIIIKTTDGNSYTVNGNK